MRFKYSSDPNDARYWPNALPTREQVTVARAMLRRGVNHRSVCEATGLSSNRVGHIAANPGMYDTVDDDVAIARALDGDGSVLPAMTLFERATLRHLLVERLIRDPHDPRINNHKASLGEPFWLSELARMWGVDPDRLRAQLNKRKDRARVAA